jgi:hypothetical protein
MEHDDVLQASDAHELARGFELQQFGRRRPFEIDDPLVEPAWPGLRTIAAVSGSGATLWWDGEAFDERPEVTSALARMTGASVDGGAIFEGYVTKQITPEGIGVGIGHAEVPSASRVISRLFIGGGRDRAREYQERQKAEREAQIFGEDDVVNLVLVDLLWLDGQWLLDVPLLERKRVLESIVPAEQLVRPGLYVREPVGSMIGSWRAQGFRSMMFKAANSRYRPGETADDWTRADLPHR